MITGRIIHAFLGLLVSLGLRAVLQHLIRRERSMSAIITGCVAASYFLALLWAAASNIPREPRVLFPAGSAGIAHLFGQTFLGTINNAFILLAWGFLYIGYMHYAALQRERERTLRAEALATEARLRALQHQLNPHLFFNTLNAISTLIKDGRTNDATLVITRLGDFIRTTLRQDPGARVSLADELMTVQQYLDIEQIRVGERLHVEYDIAGDAYRAHVPSLILQPLAENAIHHGIAKLPGSGTIAFRARIRNDVLILRLDNFSTDRSATDGDPVVQSSAPHVEGVGEGIGLRNVRERLQALYGDGFTLETAPLGGNGYRVRITLPFVPAV